MGRPLRIEYPGAVYMVSAFSGSRKLFGDRQDFDSFLDIVKKTATRYDWKCYSYCLLPDQFHLLIEIRQPNLSLGMRQINGMYTQYYHRTYKNRGSLFKDRFKSLLIEKDPYLLHMARYLARLPVAQGLVKGPAKWPWSSHGRLIRGSKANQQNDYLEITDILSYFETASKSRKKAYKQFIKEGETSLSPLLFVKKPNCLGSEAFCSAASKKVLGCTKKQAGSQAHLDKKRRPSLQSLFAKQDKRDRAERNARIVTAHIKHGYLVREIAEHLELHYTTVSKVINRP